MLYGTMDITDLFDLPFPLPAALTFLRDVAPTISDGRHDLPDGMYVEIKHYSPASVEERPFESHIRYADVQVVLEGEEQIHVRPCNDSLPVKEDCLAERDIIFCHDPEPSSDLRVFPMTPGYFLLLLPNDAHKAECLTTVTSGRKAILKIPLAAVEK
ncbi:MAG: YhcH/YjgK/YiaL family protein [Planctomycetes bacterium]|nr:YhcH/YjgK/YiaL family protein [Planctomycetota bacterium]